MVRSGEEELDEPPRERPREYKDNEAEEEADHEEGDQRVGDVPPRKGPRILELDLGGLEVVLARPRLKHRGSETGDEHERRHAKEEDGDDRGGQRRRVRGACRTTCVLVDKGDARAQAQLCDGGNACQILHGDRDGIDPVEGLNQVFIGNVLKVLAYELAERDPPSGEVDEAEKGGARREREAHRHEDRLLAAREPEQCLNVGHEAIALALVLGHRRLERFALLPRKVARALASLELAARVSAPRGPVLEQLRHVARVGCLAQVGEVGDEESEAAGRRFARFEPDEGANGHGNVDEDGQDPRSEPDDWEQIPLGDKDEDEREEHQERDHRDGKADFLRAEGRVAKHCDGNGNGQDVKGRLGLLLVVRAT